MSWQDEAVIDDLLQRIQMHIMPRRVRCREYFNDFDKLRCGRCTEEQFARAINMIGVNLTDEEMKALARHFTDHGPRAMKPQVVNHLEFCKAVDQVFGSEDIQDGLKSTMLTTSPGSTFMSTFVPNELEEEERVENLLHKVAALCKARGCLIKPIYTDLDRAPIPSASRMNPRRSGKVTKNQFIKNWPFKKEMTMDDIDLICEKYTTKNGDVHYMALHNEVSEVLGDPAQPFPTSPLHLRPDDTEWSHHNTGAVDRVRAKVAEKKARLKEHFQDFDPLRKGFCTPGQVKTVFTIMNISKDIDKSDYESLVAQYSGDDGRFDYRSFCAEVDSAFTRPGLERDPLAVLEMPDATTTSPARRNTIKLNARKQEKIVKLEDMVRAHVRKRNLEMKPVFQDFDKAHRGYVSRSQFQRTLTTFGLDLSEKQIGYLCNMYCDYGNHNDFNYVRFLKNVDPLSEDVETALMQLTSPHTGGNRPKSYFNSDGRVMPKSFSTPML